MARPIAANIAATRRGGRQDFGRRILPVLFSFEPTRYQGRGPYLLPSFVCSIVVLHMGRGLAMFLRLVPLAILAWAIAGVAFGLIADLPVFFRVCVLIAVAAIPLVLLGLWLAFASRRDERDELSRK
jgi:hypothetical protein